MLRVTAGWMHEYGTCDVQCAIMHDGRVKCLSNSDSGMGGDWRVMFLQGEGRGRRNRTGKGQEHSRVVHSEMLVTLPAACKLHRQQLYVPLRGIVQTKGKVTF